MDEQVLQLSEEGDDTDINNMIDVEQPTVNIDLSGSNKKSNLTRYQTIIDMQNQKQFTNLLPEVNNKNSFQIKKQQTQTYTHQTPTFAR